MDRWTFFGFLFLFVYGFVDGLWVGQSLTDFGQAFACSGQRYFAYSVLCIGRTILPVDPCTNDVTDQRYSPTNFTY
jgi:hypothetical protein